MILCTLIGLTSTMSSQILWNEEGVLYKNINDSEYTLTNSSIIELNNFPVLYGTSYSIKELNNFQLLKISDELKLDLLKINFILTGRFEDDILTKEDSLQLCNIYALGQKAYKYFEGVTTLFVVCDYLNDLGYQSFISTYCFNLQDGKLKSIFRISDEIFSHEVMKIHGDFIAEGLDYATIKMSYSILFEDMDPDSPIIDEEIIQIDKKGLVSK